MPAQYSFHKRIYTFRTLLSDVRFLISKSRDALALARSETITRAFIEKIMTVVTAVNGCVYCSWFHAHQAVKSGLSQQEVHNLFSLQFAADASNFELPALLYAQHYAETNRHPHPDMDNRLLVHYGETIANQIKLIIRIITFGNLSGNTWDAILSRMRGNPAPHSSLLFEVFFFLLTWIAMLPAIILSKNYRAAHP